MLLNHHDCGTDGQVDSFFIRQWHVDYLDSDDL